MKTAEDLFNEWKELYQFEEGDPEYLVDKEDFRNALKDFATMYVEAATKAIKENVLLSFVPHDEEAWEQKEITREDIYGFYADGEDEEFAIEQLIKRDGFTIEIDEESFTNSYPLTNIQ